MKEIMIGFSVIINKNISQNDSSKAGVISECLVWKEITSDRWTLKTFKWTKLDINSVKKIFLG